MWAVVDVMGRSRLGGGGESNLNGQLDKGEESGSTLLLASIYLAQLAGGWCHLLGL